MQLVKYTNIKLNTDTNTNNKRWDDMKGFRSARILKFEREKNIEKVGQQVLVQNYQRHNGFHTSSYLNYWKLGHQVVPLALITNLATRDCPISFIKVKSHNHFEHTDMQTHRSDLRCTRFNIQIQMEKLVDCLGCILIQGRQDHGYCCWHLV